MNDLRQSDKRVTPINFRLRGYQIWNPDLGENAALPALLRRRITPAGRHALNAAWGLPDLASARLVLSSRHGEFSRTLSLLESVATGCDVSPSDFTLSVHHALIGLLSIAVRNRRGHSGVAAGNESFCFGFLEALICLKENPTEPVVLIHFDEPLPGPFASFNCDGEKPVALALLLQAEGEGDLMQMTFSPAPSNKELSSSHAQDFLDFLLGNSKEVISKNENRQWLWKRHADR